MLPCTAQSALTEFSIKYSQPQVQSASITVDHNHSQQQLLAADACLKVTLTVMQGCQGYAPRYSTSQKGHLRQSLFAARQILLDCFGKLEDSRTGQDLIPWMLQVSLSSS